MPDGYVERDRIEIETAGGDRRIKRHILVRVARDVACETARGKAKIHDGCHHELEWQR